MIFKAVCPWCYEEFDLQHMGYRTALEYPPIDGSGQPEAPYPQRFSVWKCGRCKRTHSISSPPNKPNVIIVKWGEGEE